MILTSWKIIFVRIFRVENPEATGDQIKHALMHVGAQAIGAAQAFAVDWLAQTHLGWRTIVLQGFFSGAVGNVYLQLKTPRVKAQIEQAKLSSEVVAVSEVTSNEPETN